ncbi:MAG: isocitrate/isopropylmalate family dehydrogenase [Arhodomonas sp.]|nr:isocitrate/isopropylmalate family dehydrogenase [Arhodomonas sp.]
MLEALRAELSASKSSSRAGSIGGAAIDAEGTPLPEATLAPGAPGGRRSCSAPWAAPSGTRLERHLRPEQRAARHPRGAGTVRQPPPGHPLPAARPTPRRCKPEMVAGLDILIVRELTGGIYFGEPRGMRTPMHGERRGYNTLVYSESEIERIARLAFDIAGKRQGRVMLGGQGQRARGQRALARSVDPALAADYPDVEL